MVDKENGLLFHWKQRDFEPLRAFIALLAAASLFLLLSMYLTLPFTKGNEQLKENRISDLRKSSGQRSINYLSPADVARLDSDADFQLYDRFRLENHFLLRAEKQADLELKRLQQQWSKERPTYEIQYQAVSYNPSYTVDKPKLKPTLPDRPLPNTQIITPEPRSNGKITMRLSDSLPPLLKQDPVIPFHSLEINGTSLQIELHVAKNGRVLYAIPSNAHSPSPRILRWIKNLRFSESKSPRYGSLILKQIVITE